MSERGRVENSNQTLQLPSALRECLKDFQVIVSMLTSLFGFTLTHLLNIKCRTRTEFSNKVVNA